MTGPRSVKLGWEARLNIAIGVAEGKFESIIIVIIIVIVSLLLV